MSCVAIRPRIPSFGIKVRLSMSPMADVIMVSFRLTSVFPWLFMRFPMLRFPNAEYRYSCRR